MALKTQVLHGEQIKAALEDLAHLRITVFREWPYLYDGNETYEKEYLAPFEQSETAILVAAFDGDVLVGASTGTPMADHASEFAEPLKDCGVPLEQIFYCAESVLLPAYRGKGLGHQFFDHREAHAKKLGHDYSAFCAVIREDNHPRRPDTPRSLEPFWRARGYSKLEGAIAQYPWKTIDTDDEIEHSLQFWMRKL